MENSLKEYRLNTSQCNNDPSDVPLQFEEVQGVIQNLPNKKASGLDDITYEHLKYCGYCLTEFLVKIFNEIRETEHVPNKWTQGCIISILKSGKRNKLKKAN